MPKARKRAETVAPTHVSRGKFATMNKDDIVLETVHARCRRPAHGRSLRPDQVDERATRRGEDRQDRGEREQRHERREPADHSTSKKPIQPSSVNSDWWAWNMNLPGLWKSISITHRSPWQSITVSVYSNWSVEPVR